MLNKVEARTDRGDLLTLLMQDNTEGYTVQDIEGLDPVKAIIVSSSFANLNGEQYQSSKREKRQLVFKIGMNPDWALTSVSALRNKLYKWFMPTENVNLTLFDDDGFPTVTIKGRIESFDAPLFAKDPVATIVILCHEPDFVSSTPVVFNGATTSGSTETDLTYAGTVDTGFVFTLSLNRTLTAFTMFLKAPDDTVRSLEFSGSLINLDVLKISTVPGDKYARLTRAGVTTSILYGVSPTSAWVGLEPGLNKVRVLAAGAAIPYTIGYSNRFGGL